MTTLSLGTQVMQKDVIYALPSKAIILFTDASNPVLQASNDPSFGLFVSQTLKDAQLDGLAAPYIRCTSGDITVTLKAR